MNVILCATRGGEASINTQERAIELAKEREAKLVFFFVADVRFLEKYSAPRVPGMEEEIVKMGEFLLLMAKERAEKVGVTAEFIVKIGEFKTEMIATAQEQNASVIVLGSPADKSVTTLEYLEQELSPAIREATGAEVIVV